MPATARANHAQLRAACFSFERKDKELRMRIADFQTQAQTILHTAGILPVVTVQNLTQAHHLARALLEGGLRVLELTLRTPVALEALTALKREWPDILIGAGTVLTAQHIQQSIDAGADFLVTPGTPEPLAQHLAKATLPVVPGAATPTEFLALMQHGFRVCKLFPANAVGGLQMIKGLAGPLPELRLCPTGGITETNAQEFLIQPNVACIGGSWMVQKEWVAQENWGAIKASAGKAAQLIAQVRHHQRKS